MKLHRILAILLKNLYVTKRSFARLISLFYWVTMELLLWGFITIWLRQVLTVDSKAGVAFALLTALIFWDMFVRTSHALSVTFLEDIWTRNVINIFASPLTTGEFVVSLILISIFQGLLAFFYITLLALALYALNIWSLGFYIIPFFVNIFLFGWAIGLVVVGLLMRFGPSVEVLAWSIPFLLLPFSAVYYPLAVLPDLLQKIAFFIPPMHLFEGMRQILFQGALPLYHIGWATLLSLIYLALAFLFFRWILNLARKKGLIARLVTV